LALSLYATIELEASDWRELARSNNHRENTQNSRLRLAPAQVSAVSAARVYCFRAARKPPHSAPLGQLPTSARQREPPSSDDAWLLLRFVECWAAALMTSL